MCSIRGCSKATRGIFFRGLSVNSSGLLASLVDCFDFDDEVERNKSENFLILDFCEEKFLTFFV